MQGAHLIASRSSRGASLVARVTGIGLLNLLQDSAEVVGLRSLQRGELLVRQQMLLPQPLADRQHIPVVLEGGHRRAERTANAHGRLHVDADCLLERIALDVLDQGEVERDERQIQPAGPGCDMV